MTINVNKLKYSVELTPFSRQQVLEEVSQRLSSSRFEHVLRVEQTALALAVRQKVSLERVSLAALTHDIAKEMSQTEAEQIAKAEQLAPSIFSYGSAIWHGPIGAEVVKKLFQVNQPEVLEAIAVHTTGAAEMNQIAQIIYVADYIEPGHDFSAAAEARKRVKQNLTEGIVYITQQTLIHLIQQKQKIHPQTLITYNAWIEKQ